MLPLSWYPREMEAWRAFEEGEPPTPIYSPSWPAGLTWRKSLAQGGHWRPDVELWEKEDSFIVRAELPGVKKEDIEIFTTTDTLTIGGTREAPANIESKEYRRREVAYGPFSRSITMPAPVDPDEVEATYEDGILEVRVPKAKEAEPRRIPIKVK